MWGSKKQRVIEHMKGSAKGPRHVAAISVASGWRGCTVSTGVDAKGLTGHKGVNAIDGPATEYLIK